MGEGDSVRQQKLALPVVSMGCTLQIQLSVKVFLLVSSVAETAVSDSVFVGII